MTTKKTSGMIESASRFSLVIVGRSYEISAISKCFESTAVQVYGLPTDMIPRSGNFNEEPLAGPLCILPLCHDYKEHLVKSKLILEGGCVLFPEGESAKIETDRIFAFDLAKKVGLPVASSYLFEAKAAMNFVNESEVPIVLKNPRCPARDGVFTSIFHSKSTARAFLKELPQESSVFLQEHVSGSEISHTAFVSGENISSLVTSREFKAISPESGELLMPPIAGISEVDPDDQYGLAKQLLHPLRSWLSTVGYRGFLQVSAILAENVCSIIEFNIRLGVTVGPLLLQQLKNPSRFIESIAFGECVEVEVEEGRGWACSLTPIPDEETEMVSKGSQPQAFFGFGGTRNFASDSLKQKIELVRPDLVNQIPGDFEATPWVD